MPTAPKRPVLLAKHLAALRARGLSDETIRLSGVHSETDPERIQRVLGWQYPSKGLGACLVIPFWDAAGTPTGYSRVRPDMPRVLDGGRVAKYEAPVGQPSRVYFPPRARAAVGDNAVTVVFTEGEFKALAADQHGWAAIGLTGVSMWSKPKESDGEVRQLHPDLQKVAWDGRAAIIVFDSDVVYKDQVRWEEWAFAKALQAAGACVTVVRLPAPLGGPKVGLDDFLAAQGANAVEAFRALVARAQEPCLPPLGFTNTVRRPHPDKPGEVIETGRSIIEMAAELVGRSGGWPRNVGGTLVAPDHATGVRAIDDASALGAFIHGLYDVGGISRSNWDKGPTHPTRPELYAYLEAHAERFDRADPLPHQPPIPGVFYTRPRPVTDGKYEAIAGLFGFLQPATAEDKSLLLAMLLTLFWGGPAGKRPAFLIEGAENDPEAGRGLGKTTVAQKFAGLAGGAFEIDASEPFARTRSRLLTPEAGNYRSLLMDNVKTFRLSSADLEGLITNPFINGHRLYHGQAGVPNYYTVLITLNGASLSKDIAQRVVTVRLKRVPYQSGWEAALDRFIAANRDRLIGDMLGLLSRPPARLPAVSRWGAWEADVLARVENPVACWNMIRARAGEHDADREDADRIRETLGEVVFRHNGTNAQDLRFLLSSAAVTALVGQALNNRILPAASASAMLKALGVTGFRKSNRRGRRLWEWRGDRHPLPAAKERVPLVLTWNPELERNDEGRVIGDHWEFVTLEQFAPESCAEADDVS